jgi:D-inositol-3-phosphate glycosyltransferase
MRAVILERAPEDVELRKASDPQAFVVGAQVYAAGAARALLEYGTYDRYFVAHGGRPSEYNLLNLAPGGAPRLELLTAEAAAELSPGDTVVLLTDRPVLNTTARLRRQLCLPAAPIVGMIHNLQGDMGTVVRMMLEGEVRPFDAIMCSSAAGRQAFRSLLDAIADGLRRRGVPADLPVQLPLVPLGLDTASLASRDKAQVRQRLGLDAAAVVALYVGRFAPYRKCDLVPLLIAFASSARTRADLQLWLAGDDTELHLAEQLCSVAAELGIGGRVVVKPNPSREEKQDLLCAADLFVAPSDHLQETFGISVAEAMAAGLPVVASDWDGYKNLVTHGTTGFLAPTWLPRLPADFEIGRPPYGATGLETLAQTTITDVSALAHSIGVLADDANLRRRMGQAARTEAQARYDWRVVVGQYEALWADLHTLAADAHHECSTDDSPFEQPFYQEVFAHYPTAMLEDRDVVRPVADATAWANQPGPCWQQLIGSHAAFSTTVFQRILAFVGRSGAAPLADLVAAVAGAGIGEHVVRAHAARLVKYNLLALDTPQDVGRWGH